MKKMNNYKMGLLLLLVISIMSSCEEAFIPDPELFEEQYVVEGFVEASNADLPVYVIFTKSFPYFETLDANTLNELFVSGAVISVNDGDKDVVLQEVCLSNLPDEIKELVATQFGLDLENPSIEFCVYLDVLNQVTKEIGRSYDLNISIDGNMLTATTTIPEFVPLDTFYFEDPPGMPSDTLIELWSRINDPRDVTNYYRYFTEVNDDGIEIPFQSVTNDAFFDGQEFDFPLNRADDGEDIDLTTFGLFTRGDSATIKWLNMDEAHFDFWNTLEFSRANQGPFASYTRIKSNINGGLGVWGGYSAEEYRIKIPD